MPLVQEVHVVLDSDDEEMETATVDIGNELINELKRQLKEERKVGSHPTRYLLSHSGYRS